MEKSKVFILTLTFLLIGFLAQSQTVPNFTVTDSDGVEHNLYEDYLDKGTTVALKLFFVNCPPCRSIAPQMQTLYEDWGEGEYDVQFLELSIRSTDSNADVAGYKSDFDLTFPGVGNDGGALTALAPYLNGDFGPFFGTPTFAVIAPDKTIDFNTGGGGNSGKIANLNAAIEATGATGAPSAEPSSFSVAFFNAFNETVPDVNVTLSDATNTSLSYPVGNSLDISIQNLTSEFPGISSPVLHFSKANDIRKNIAPLDILLIRKHILGIIPITDNNQLVAADTNGDGIISPLDMLVLQKVILGIFQEFPIDSYQFVPSEIPLNLVPGETQNFNVTAIKVGDLNGF